MRLIVIKWNVRQPAGPCQHRMADSEAGQRGGVEMREGVKRIPFQPQPLSGGI
jgi:hypothetical protein